MCILLLIRSQLYLIWTTVSFNYVRKNRISPTREALAGLECVAGIPQLNPCRHSFLFHQTLSISLLRSMILLKHLKSIDLDVQNKSEADEIAQEQNSGFLCISSFSWIRHGKNIILIILRFFTDLEVFEEISMPVRIKAKVMQRPHFILLM